jgi:hypothetical protein
MGRPTDLYAEERLTLDGLAKKCIAGDFRHLRAFAAAVGNVRLEPRTEAKDWNEKEPVMGSWLHNTTLSLSPKLVN